MSASSRRAVSTMIELPGPRRADLAAELDPVGVRKPQVEQHEIGARVGERGACCRAVGRKRDAVSLGRECLLERTPDRGIVLDEQHGGGHRIRVGALCHRSPACDRQSLPFAHPWPTGRFRPVPYVRLVVRRDACARTAPDRCGRGMLRRSSCCRDLHGLAGVCAIGIGTAAATWLGTRDELDIPRSLPWAAMLLLAVIAVARAPMGSQRHVGLRELRPVAGALPRQPVSRRRGPVSRRPRAPARRRHLAAHAQRRRSRCSSGLPRP